jgi:glycosyltransferase involved in cell wall biosynthesis
MKTQILISIITPTLNNEKDIKNFLESLKRQTYFENTEVIIADGGSSDKTLEIAKKYKVKVFNNKKIFADIGVNEATQRAKGKLIMILATDNLFREKNSLEKMVNVFDDKKITAAFPKQDSLRVDTIYTKYINTFTDPVNHFVYGYAANPRTFEKIYKIQEKRSDYIIFEYSSSIYFPMIAFAQGFTVRSGFNRSKKNEFDDTTPVIELLKDNKKIAYVDSVTLYHHTINSLGHFIEKQSWRTRNYLQKKNFGISHRAKLLPKKQTDRIRIWPIYSLTILPPFVYASYHLIKDREIMWIFHPLLCIISGYTSLITVIIYRLRKWL